MNYINPIKPHLSVASTHDYQITAYVVGPLNETLWEFPKIGDPNIVP